MSERKRESGVLGRDEEKVTKRERERLIDIEIDEDLEREGEREGIGNMKT